MKGEFEFLINDDNETFLYLSLEDGRKVSLSCDDKMIIHDLSWNNYFDNLRDRILGIMHSEIELDQDLLLKIHNFIDNAGIPPNKT